MDAELKNCGVNCFVAGSLLCFVVALAAITPPPVLKVNIIVNNPPRKTAVIFGLLTWEANLEDFQWELSRDDDAWVFRDWQGSDDVLMVQEQNKLKSGTFFAGYTAVPKRLVALNSSIGINNLYEVAVHEIGHVLGLNHSLDASSIMYPTNEGGDAQSILVSDLLPLNGIYRVQAFNFKPFIPYQYREFYILKRSWRSR